jgi:D-aspartate ligase
MDLSRVAFVLYMGPNGLGVTRSLGWSGIKVIGVDYHPEAAGLRSKFVQPFITTDPVREPEATVEMLLEKASEFREKPVIMCCSDDYVLLVSRNRKRLSEGFEFMVAPEKVVESTMNKSQQYQLAVEAGVPIPFTIYPQSMDEILEAKDSLTYPCFIKPFYSHLWYRHFGNKGYIVKSYDELRQRFTSILETDLRAMVQSIVGIPGKDLYQVSAYFGRDGYVSPRFVWFKARQNPPNFGVASLGTSVKNQQVEESGLKFLRAIKYQGIGSVEFKLDPTDGTYRLIELNLRTWMQNVMCTVAGLNLPLIQYLNLTGQTCPDTGDYKDGVKWWDTLSDLDSFVRLRRRGELGAWQWVRSWLGSDCFAYFAPGDIGPALARAGYGVNVFKALTYALRQPVDEDDTQLGRKH